MFVKERQSAVSCLFVQFPLVCLGEVGSVNKIQTLILTFDTKNETEWTMFVLSADVFDV